MDDLLAFVRGSFPDGVLDARALQAMGAPPPAEFRDTHERLGQLFARVEPRSEADKTSTVFGEPEGEVFSGALDLDGYPFSVQAGPDWAWESAFITVALDAPLTPAAEAAVIAEIEGWWRVGSDAGFGTGHLHNFYAPSFVQTHESTTVRLVVDFGSADESAFHRLMSAIQAGASTQGATIRGVLLNVEDPYSFNLNG